LNLATEENLNNLVNVGKQLLKKKVTRVNLDKGTNGEALKRFILFVIFFIKCFCSSNQDIKTRLIDVCGIAKSLSDVRKKKKSNSNA